MSIRSNRTFTDDLVNLAENDDEFDRLPQNRHVAMNGIATEYGTDDD